MKRSLLCAAILAFCMRGFSQVSPRFRTDSLPPDIRERLVTLAMQNPSEEIDDRNISIAQWGVKKAKSNILNQVAVQGNLNEFSISPNQQTANLYPKYNFGVIIPFGIFTSRSQDVHIARENLGISVAQKNEHYRELREAVLSKFEDYLEAVDLLNLERQLVEDAFTHYQKVEKAFAEAKVTDDEYTLAYRNYNTEQAKQRGLEKNLRIVKLQMERYIGKPLDDVLNEYKK